MTKDEKNRKIAEWLGWATFPDGMGGHRCQRTMHNSIESLPDFFTSEEASALVLEKIRQCDKAIFIGPDYLEIFSNDHGECEPEITIADESDRKTAIAEAALALIQQEKVEP